ncbi:MAG: hypothetical protein P8Y42_18440, partial [Exilibacterium sp.]
CFSAPMGHPWPGPAPSLALVAPKQLPKSPRRERLSFQVCRCKTDIKFAYQLPELVIRVVLPGG